MTFPSSGACRRSPRGSLVGYVTEQDGTPCSGWWMIPSVEPDAYAQVEEAARFTAPDGHYRWSLQVGDYWVTAIAPDHQRKTDTTHVVIEAGQTTETNLHPSQ